MKKNLLSFILILSFVGFVSAKINTENWTRQELDLRVNKNSKIKGIKYPADKPVPTRASKQENSISESGEETVLSAASSGSSTSSSSGTVFGTVINLPPVDGFIPWIAVATTDERGEDLDMVTVEDDSFSTRYATSNAASEYVIGLFDTGASAHIMGYEASNTLGLNSSTYLTENEISVSGVTGSVDVSVSYPLGIFIQGLSAINSMGLLDTTQLVGETNTSIVIGQDPGSSRPDLPTAIGTPLAVYYDAVFDNDNPISLVVDSNGVEETYSAPDIKILTKDNSETPEYANTLPLELRPLGSYSVQYTPSYDFYSYMDGDILDMNFDPGSPSVIMGNLSQSVFFVHSVDLTEGDSTASDKDRFMIDTGAQVTVIGQRIAARLGLDENEPDFLVEIEGVTGDIEDMPGFYIDAINIPALGEWLKFTNVPVVLLDVASPEGGTLDGIIGMNLFVEYNFVLKGGGLFLTDDPEIQFERKTNTCNLTGDIAPSGGDCVVNELDLTVVAANWQTNEAPAGGLAEPGDIVNIADFAVIASNWLATGN